MHSIAQRINQNGLHLLEALGYTGNIHSLTQDQVYSILSLQNTYFLIVEHTKMESEILLADKKRQGGHINRQKIQQILFGKQTNSL